MATWLEISTHVSAIFSVINTILLVTANYKIYRRRARLLLAAATRCFGHVGKFFGPLITRIRRGDQEPKDIESSSGDPESVDRCSKIQPPVGTTHAHLAGGRYLPLTQPMSYGTMDSDERSLNKNESSPTMDSWVWMDTVKPMLV